MATGNGNGSGNLQEIATALSAVVGVFAALAVAGVLGQAQRNHGYWLLAGIVFVLVGAVLWLGATLFGKAPRGRKKSASRAFRIVALISFAVGLVLGIFAIGQTQQDSERPEVTSSYDGQKGVLTVDASAHGLRTDSRLVLEVSGFTGTPDDPNPQKKPPTLYFAVAGPNADGDVDHTAQVPIPTKYTVVGVRAWTGKKPTTCTAEGVETKETDTPQHARVGCLFLQVRMPPVRCVVPRVVGLQLPRARRKIVRAHCRVGRVVKVVSSARRRNKALAQSPGPGRRFAAGHRVNLRVGKSRPS